MTGRSFQRLLADFTLRVFSSIIFGLIVTSSIVISLSIISCLVWPKLSAAQVASMEQPAVRGNASFLPSVSPAATARSPFTDELSKRYPRFEDDLALQHFARSAGIIFSGQVTSIGSGIPSVGQPPQALIQAPTQAPTITFRVENALRGTSPGQSLTIHEWAGLGQSDESYHVGERVLLFLYAPGKLGLTSPVAGSMGKFRMNAEGKVQINPQQRQFFATDPLIGGKTVVPYIDFAGALRSISKPKK